MIRRENRKFFDSESVIFYRGDNSFPGFYSAKGEKQEKPTEKVISITSKDCFALGYCNF